MPPKARKTKAAVQAKIVEDAIEPPNEMVAFKPWKSSTKLPFGGRLSEQERSGTVEVLHREAFVLKPLTITEGQLKGRHVLMLEPVENEDYFRFMDLPPELRKMVYDILLPEVKAIEIQRHKVVHEPWRPVRASFTDKVAHRPMKLESATGKWIGQVPSSFALLRVSKQLLAETAPVAYGANVFELDCFRDAEIFLETISGMRLYVKAIKFGRHAYEKSKARGIFDFLTDAVNLRSIRIKHHTFCSGDGNDYCTAGVTEFVKMCRPAIEKMHKARKTDSVAVPVLDLLQVDAPQLCYHCKKKDGGNCTGCCGSRPCSEAEEHRVEVAGELRARLAKALGIKEDE
ncbi:hypothetical protein LTR27_002464 [Elasticomyces elasticus]|nr:hypothetical protein LTR27_002464 [Elasticomyces elasticus]